MKKYFLIVFLLSGLLLTAKEKYLVYFIDKELTQNQISNKSNSESLLKLSGLTQKAVERRKKTLGENFIRMEDIPVNASYVEMIKESGAAIIHELKWFNAVSCYLDGNTYKRISALPFVREIRKVNGWKNEEPVKSEDRSGINKLNKSGSFFDYGFSLSQMQLSDVPDVHSAGIAGKGVLIGLLDAGFKWAHHRALQNIDVIATRDFVYGDDDVSNDPDIAHGTAVLSLVAGFKESELISPAYEASFLLAKTENILSETHVEEDNFAAGLEWMESQGVDIVSASLGYSEFDPGEGSYTYSDMDGKTTIVTKAMEQAFQLGVLTINSAGNEGNKSWYYITAPADGFNVLAIGAVTSSNELASFSSHGPTFDGRIKPDLVTQGASCYVASSSSDGYYFGSGTSFSSPIAAGIAAQLLSKFPHLNNLQLRTILLEAGGNVHNPNNNIGYGLLSAKRALVFPNIKVENGVKTINKFFVDINEFASAPPVIFIKQNDAQEFEEHSLVKIDGKTFSYEISPASAENLEFYFTYMSLDGQFKRQPDINNYMLDAQKNNVYLVTDVPSVDPPEEYFLFQNYPNPFNAMTKISFSLPEDSHVTLKIYNFLGQEIKTLLNEFRQSGFYDDLIWNGTNDANQIVSSGAYAYVLTAENSYQAKKLIYLK